MAATQRTRLRPVGSRSIGPSLRSMAAVIALAATTIVLTDARPAQAHTPHDVVASTALSPEFAEDHTAYSVVREYIVKTTDGGDTWKRLVNGLDNKRHLSAVAVAQNDADRVYAATRGDGMYRSDDAGGSWRPVNDGLEPPLSFVHLYVSPENADLLYAVDNEGKVVRTTTGGESWASVDDSVEDVTAMAFHGEVTFAGGDGVLSRSDDQGESWEQTDVGSSHVNAIAVSPDFDSDLTMFLGMDSEGVLESTDGGRTFSEAGSGISDERTMSLVVSPEFSTDARLWVSTWNDGVFRTDDGGESWSKMSDGLTGDNQAELLDVPQYRALVLTGDSDSTPTIFLDGFDGLFRTTDGAETWEEVTTQDSTTIVDIAVSPNYAEDRTVAVASYINGAYRTEDDGSTWTAINDGLTSEVPYLTQEDYYARLTSMAISPDYATDQTMYAGSRGYLFTSTSRGDAWDATIPDGLVVPDDFPPDYLIPAFSPDYANDRTMFAGTDTGKMYRSVDGAPMEQVGEVGSEIVQMDVSPNYGEDGTLIAATVEGASISSDRGETWETVDGTPKGMRSVTISSGFAEDRTAFIGTKSGLLVTKDGGSTWKKVAGQPFGDAAYIEAAVASPTFGEDGTILVSARGSGMFRSTDGGNSFEPIAKALLDDNQMISSFYHSTSAPIVFSPAFDEDQTVFASSGSTLLRSTDAGDTWAPVPIPRSTHPVTRESAPNDLLVTPRAEETAASDRGPVTAGSRGADSHPVLTLSVKRVAAAAAAAGVALAAMWVLKAGSRTSKERLAICFRIASAGVVFAVVLFLVSIR